MQNIDLVKGTDGTWTLQAAQSVDKPSMELAEGGFLGGITKMDIMGVPLGAGVAGGAISVLASSLATSLLKKELGTIGKLALAWALAGPGKRFLGETGRYAAIFLAWDALRGQVEPLVTTGLVSKVGLAEAPLQDYYRGTPAPPVAPNTSGYSDLFAALGRAA